MSSHHLILYCSLLLLPSIFPSIGDFPMSKCFLSGDQSIGVSASASVLPMNIQGLFPLGLTGLISIQFKGLSSLLQHHNSKALILWHSAFFMVQLSHLYMTIRKIIALTRQTFVGKVCFLICCLGLASLYKIHHSFHSFPPICRKVMGSDAMILVFCVFF